MTSDSDNINWKDEQSCHMETLFIIFLILNSFQNEVVNIVNTLWVLLYCMCSSAHFKAFAVGFTDWKLSDQRQGVTTLRLLHLLFSDCFDQWHKCFDEEIWL